ncbi:PAS domain-containing protein [Aquabacterium humicola]|uniref:PAS domain-containing protein n=1 Tax=Aquabacterium humicola TaxID=3237377 RepID=UPI0025430A40|nr:PAS domain-containing protein [Rubrivivax pictus]
MSIRFKLRLPGLSSPAAARHRDTEARQALQRELEALQSSAAQQAQALAAAEQQARAAQAALSASEERYALALRGSTDGLWEWDLERERVSLSPRWQHMFGLGPDPDTMSVAEWSERLHPDDRDGALQALRAHLAGASERYEHAHRVLHADGRHRWVLSRASAIRRAAGSPYRVIGIDTDITRIKRAETIIEAIAEGTAARSGAPFFQALVMHFARALHVDVAFITECADRPPTRVRTLAHWRDGDFDANFEYELAGTPCERVIREGRTCFHPSGLGRAFEREAGQEGYLGLPIVGREGRVIGHLAFVHGRPLAGDDVLLESVYRIFTARAGVEIELDQALKRLDAAALAA